MIKSIKVRTSKELLLENIDPKEDTTKMSISQAVASNNIKETVALSTSVIEDLLFNNNKDFISESWTKPEPMQPCEVNHTLEILLINQDSRLDLIKALKDGDILAKKRLLKQLEEL